MRRFSLRDHVFRSAGQQLMHDLRAPRTAAALGAAAGGWSAPRVRRSALPLVERAAVWLLGAGTAWTTATQLRAGGVLGLGELVLAGAIGLAALEVLARGSVAWTPLLGATAAFWGTSFVLLVGGWVVGLWTDVWQLAAGRDLIALLLAALVMLAFLQAPRLERRARAVTWVLLATLVPPIVALGVLTLTGRPQVGPVNALYEELRFTGWATNPNQIALAVVALPLLGLRLLPHVRGLRRAALVTLLVGTLVVGAATFSDALALAWAITAALLGVLLWLRLLASRRSVAARALAALGVPLVVLAGAVAFGPTLVVVGERFAAASYREGGQGSDRLARWRNALDAAETSPLVGLGPGAYSGPIAAFQGQEVHNTPLDWMLSTGLLGLLAYAGLVAWVVAVCAAGRDSHAIVGVIALLVFTTFHYALRQPVFWMQLLLLAAPHAARRPADALRASPRTVGR